MTEPATEQWRDLHRSFRKFCQATPWRGSVCLRSTWLESSYDYWRRYTQRKRNPAARSMDAP